MNVPVIALLTDFGEEDWFVGTMKGVMKSIAPAASLIDITHGVPPFDVRGGALALRSSYRFFPENTVFCCVVDPGVGTERSALCATDGRQFFIAPDNGLLTLVVRDAGAGFRAYRAQNRRYFLKETSFTFQGRDVFAPLAAHIASGLLPERTGPPANDLVLLEAPAPKGVSPTALRGEVFYVDRFGNLITNIERKHAAEFQDSSGAPENWKLKIQGVMVSGPSRTFANRERGELLFYWGSSDLLEIAVNQDSAAKILNASPGCEVALFFH